MKHNIEFKHFEPNERARRLVEDLIDRIEKYVNGFDEEAVFLRVLIEENAVRTLYQVSITLDLPGRVLAAREERHDVIETIRDAFAEIERQIKKLKASLRGEQYWKRLTRREEVRRKKKLEAIPPEERDRELFVGLITQHLDKLYSFVRRELAYHRATGELTPDDPTTDDVVDATVVRAYDEFAGWPASLEIDRWLIKLAIEQIESEIERVKTERENVMYSGEAIPEVPLSKEIFTPDDEFQDDYWPDETLKLEKIISDLNLPLPEEAAEDRELQHYVKESLTSLPQPWRRAFVLHYVEGLSVAEVAKVAGLTEDDVKRYLVYGREYLRRKLNESGTMFEEKAVTESKTTAGGRKTS